LHNGSPDVSPYRIQADSRAPVAVSTMWSVRRMAGQADVPRCCASLPWWPAYSTLAVSPFPLP